MNGLCQAHQWGWGEVVGGWGEGTGLLTGCPGPGLFLIFFSIMPAIKLSSKMSASSPLHARSKSAFLSLTFKAFHHLAPDGLSSSTFHTFQTLQMNFLLIPKQFLNACIPSLPVDPLPGTLSKLLSWGTVLLVSVHIPRS